MENAINNNNITLAGVVEREPIFSHEVFGEGYYIFMLKCSRTSGNKDTLPVMISGRLTDIREIKAGQVVTVLGQIRSFNRHVDDVKSKLILSVFARELCILNLAYRYFISNSCLNLIVTYLLSVFSALESSLDLNMFSNFKPACKSCISSPCNTWNIIRFAI